MANSRCIRPIPSGSAEDARSSAPRTMIACGNGAKVPELPDPGTRSAPAVRNLHYVNANQAKDHEVGQQ